MQEFIRFFGHGFCHQISARSFEAGGFLFSACARDTGIHLGIIFALVAAFIVYARADKKPSALPPVWYLLILALVFAPMAFDGLSSYLGLRDTTNSIRYFTGFGAGVAAGSILAPLLFALNKSTDPAKKCLDKPAVIVPHLLLTLGLGVLFFLVYSSVGVVSALFAVLALVALFACINLILLTLSPRLFPRHTFKHWLFLLTTCTVLALVEIALLGALRDLLMQLLFNGQDTGALLG